MPLANREVIKRWFDGRRGTAHGMRTDGDSIWSHDLEVGRTKKGKKEVFNYTWSAGIKTTSSTSSHVNALLWGLSDKINEAFDEAGLKCFRYSSRGWWRPIPCGESIYNIAVHGKEYGIDDEELKLMLNARYPDLVNIIKSVGRVVDLRSNWRTYAKKVKESWYLDFVTTSNRCVIKAWFDGYGLRSQNLWTDGRSLRAGYGKSILIGKTRRSGNKLLYDYTAKNRKYINRSISVGVGAVRKYAENWNKELEVKSP
jgi:hypothetical protein